MTNEELYAKLILIGFTIEPKFTKGLRFEKILLRWDSNENAWMLYIGHDYLGAFISPTILEQTIFKKLALIQWDKDYG